MYLPHLQQVQANHQRVCSHAELAVVFREKILPQSVNLPFILLSFPHILLQVHGRILTIQTPFTLLQEYRCGRWCCDGLERA